MNRRAFFAALAGGVSAAFALDPERALWVRGAKRISIPAPRQILASPFNDPKLVMIIREHVLRTIADGLVVARLVQRNYVYRENTVSFSGDFVEVRLPHPLTKSWQ